ncbi:outer membrane beta-barrel protein [Rheinheimera sp. WS51]|uniref:outer membrane beta-barrel protein n=1 Tax=Rheinheimera sp. WS51 TaxID=3425886 RepID=UPI003D8AFE1E
MAMVTIMGLTNQSVTKSQHLIRLLSSILLLSGSFAYADIEVKPKITASSYAYWYQAKQESSGTDRGLAFMLTPSITINRDSSNMKTSLFWQEEMLWYHDAQRSQQSGQTYNINNVVNAFNQRVSWGLRAARGYQVRDSKQGVFADIVTNSENLATTKNYGTNVNFTTLRGAATKANLSLSYDIYNVEGTTLGIDDSYSNDNYRGAVNLGSASRSGLFFWHLDGNYNLTERESYDNFESARANALIGVPLFGPVSAIARGVYERNDGSNDFLNEFRAYGAGVEVKLGKVSWVNVTWNRSSLSNEAVDTATLEIEDDEYLAMELFLAPSRRTSLSMSVDKRYFGRSMTLQGQYNLRFISIRLSASDTVRTQSQLDAEFEDLGIFVCPNGSTDLSDCFRPPTQHYIPGAGESYQQVSQYNPELNEFITLSRNVSLNIGYSKNKLSLNANASTGEDEYVETQRLNRRHTLSIQGTWRLYSDLSANAEASFYRLDYTNDDRIDDNLLASLGLTYALSKKVELKLDGRHIRRDSSLANADISETRLGISMSYEF